MYFVNKNTQNCLTRKIKKIVISLNCNKFVSPYTITNYAHSNYSAS
jgi:hypothetical protein